MLDCSELLRTPRVCTDRRDRAAISEGKSCGRPFDQSYSRSPQGEMWIMLTQMIPGQPTPIGQNGMQRGVQGRGARTFVTPVAFTHAATLSRASGPGSEGWKTRLSRLLAQ